MYVHRGGEGKGQEYQPTTLRSFISSVDLYLERKGYPTTIIEGQGFRKTREKEGFEAEVVTEIL